MLALIVWTFVIWLWMYATRIPAMYKAGIKATDIKQKSDLDVLPNKVKRVADNFNHLHEQPIVFYALVIYCHLTGFSDELNIQLAWAYVVIRIAHSLSQIVIQYIPLRFFLFISSTIVLITIAVRCVLAL
jgi:hypothetical protein